MSTIELVKQYNLVIYFLNIGQSQLNILKYLELDDNSLF